MDWDDLSDLNVEAVEDVWMHMTSLGLVLRCQSCSSSFEQIQYTLCGVAFGVLTCPHCGHRRRMTPEVFAEILERWLLDLSFDDALRVNQEVDHVMRHWHQVEPWKSFVQRRGTNLGEPTERELACYVNSVMCTRTPEEVKGD